MTYTHNDRKKDIHKETTKQITNDIKNIHTELTKGIITYIKK